MPEKCGPLFQHGHLFLLNGICRRAALQVLLDKFLCKMCCHSTVCSRCHDLPHCLGTHVAHGKTRRAHWCAWFRLPPHIPVRPDEPCQPQAPYSARAQWPRTPLRRQAARYARPVCFFNTRACRLPRSPLVTKPSTAAFHTNSILPARCSACTELFSARRVSRRCTKIHLWGKSWRDTMPLPRQSCPRPTRLPLCPW